MASSIFMNNKTKEQNNSSPLYLDNLFNQTLASISSARDDQQRVKFICDFIWETIDLEEDLTYSFYLQISGMFFYLTSNFWPEGLAPDDLALFFETGLRLQARLEEKIDFLLFKESSANILLHLALSYFYLGELEEGWKSLVKKNRISGLNSFQEVSQQTKSFESLVAPSAQDLKNSSLSNLELASAYLSRQASRGELGSDPDEILERWGKYTGFSSDSIYCCLVERESWLQAPAGARLSRLESHCRPAASSDSHNTFRFFNASVIHLDEINNCASDALEAADYLMKNFFRVNFPPCSLSISFAEKKFLYGGESLGLPLALLAITQKLLTGGHRFWFLFPAETAYAGRVDLNGEVLRIEPEALELKIQTAFFSGLRYLVIPETNLKEGSAFLYKLLSRYPFRRLELVGIKRLEDVFIDNRLAVKKSLPALVWFFKKRGLALKRAAGLVIILGLVVAALIIISRNPDFHFWKNRSPLLVKAHYGSLMAFNQENQVVWTYKLPHAFVPESLSQKLIDINGDRKEEILVAGSYKSDELLNSELFCFSRSGDVIWHYKPGKRMKTLADEFSNHYVITAFEIFEPDTNSRQKSVLVVAHHATWYPTQISLLNDKGYLTGEYWNAGYLGEKTIIIEDLDNDSWKEIILGGTNNDFQSACLFVLNSEKISGCSPASGQPEFQFRDLPPGNQEFYLLFPRSTLNQVMSLRNYTNLIEISREDKIIQVTTTEYVKEFNYEIKYNFNYRLEPIFSRPVDVMTEKVKELIASRILPSHALTELQLLKERIRYWDGQGWTYKPVRNKTAD
ncbi:MAG: hypothetical protein GYA53_09990 [Acidobacteria bacterium]|nr:hypothetical protein [Acidobacteriota bacterium]